MKANILFKTVFAFTFLLLSTNLYASEPDLTKWQRFDKGGHPDYLQPGSVEESMAHCVWHEGVSIHNIKSELITKVDWVRSVYNHSCLFKNKAQLAKFKKLSDAEVLSIHKRIDRYFNVKGNGGYEMFKRHLSWVANHEGRKQALLRAINRDDYKAFHNIYRTEQDHNEHVRRLYYATSRATERQIMNEIK